MPIFTLQHHFNVSYRESLLSATKGSSSSIFMRQLVPEGHGHFLPKGASQEASYWLIATPPNSLACGRLIGSHHFLFWCLQADFWLKTAQNSYPPGQPSLHHCDLPRRAVSWPIVTHMYFNALTVSRRLIVQISNPNPCILFTASKNCVVVLKGPSFSAFQATTLCNYYVLMHSTSCKGWRSLTQFLPRSWPLARQHPRPFSHSTSYWLIQV